VRRIRWFDPEFGEPSTPIGWPAASLVLATVFLNFVFELALGGRFWLFWPLPIYGAAVGLISLALATVFFVGPALAMQSAARSVFTVIGDALGTIPALAVRLCCVMFLPLWMGALVGNILRYLTWFWSGREWSFGAGMLMLVIIAFVFATAHQRPGTQARMAFFTCKLFLAIVIAAFLRVHDGWSIVAERGGAADLRQLRFGLSEIAQYSAPIALLAANFGSRSSTRRDVWLTGLYGMAMPLFVASAISGLIAVVTHNSSLYRPSLEPTIAMALWSDVARSAAPARMIVAMVTVFGAMRFAARWATKSAGISESPTRRGWAIVGCLVAATTFCSFIAPDTVPASALDWLGRCLGVTGGVVTAGFLTGSRVLKAPRRIDWVGTGSLITGLGTPLFVQHGPMMYAPNPWWWPWLLPSYVVGFTVCICGRLAEKVLAGRGQLRQN
jgi:hypothetical protein